VNKICIEYLLFYYCSLELSLNEVLTKSTQHPFRLHTQKVVTVIKADKVWYIIIWPISYVSLFLIGWTGGMAVYFIVHKQNQDDEHLSFRILHEMFMCWLNISLCKTSVILYNYFLFYHTSFMDLRNKIQKVLIGV